MRRLSLAGMIVGVLLLAAGLLMRRQPDPALAAQQALARRDWQAAESAIARLQADRPVLANYLAGYREASLALEAVDKSSEQKLHAQAAVERWRGVLTNVQREPLLAEDRVRADLETALLMVLRQSGGEQLVPAPASADAQSTDSSLPPATADTESKPTEPAPTVGGSESPSQGGTRQPSEGLQWSMAEPTTETAARRQLAEAVARLPQAKPTPTPARRRRSDDY